MGRSAVVQKFTHEEEIIWRSVATHISRVPPQLICLCLEGCVRINKEIGKRGRIESGGHPGTTEICLTLISPHRLYVPQSRKEGEGKRLLYQDTRNKRSICLLNNQKIK